MFVLTQAVRLEGTDVHLHDVSVDWPDWSDDERDGAGFGGIGCPMAITLEACAEVHLQTAYKARRFPGDHINQPASCCPPVPLRQENMSGMDAGTHRHS